MRATLLAAVVVVSCISPAAAAGPAGGLDVTVVNTPAVTVTNTPDVSVVNEVAVRATDHPALQPVNFGVGLGTGPFPNAGVFQLNGPEYTVPAGKRLVIEFVSAEFATDTGALTSAYLYVRTTTAGFRVIGGTSESVACEATASCIAISKLVRIYANPGDKVAFRGVLAVNKATSAPLFMNHGFSGHLVDLP
jgi:hypothetical protein